MLEKVGEETPKNKVTVELWEIPVTGKEGDDLIMDYQNRTFIEVVEEFEIESTSTSITTISSEIGNYNIRAKALARKLITTYPNTIKLKFLNTKNH